MYKEILKIMKPGLLTTIQDTGRYGYQQYGMAVSGAMDTFAMQIANILVGNERSEAVIEIAEVGPTIHILEDIVISICGADLSPTIDGNPIPLWVSMKVRKGETIEFGRPVIGRFAYLAISGGIEVPVILGSKSTYIKASIGGYHGRSLKSGDVLIGYPLQKRPYKGFLKQLPSSFIPDYQSKKSIRVIIGPDIHKFTDDGLATFLNNQYIIGKSNRMGYRLQGPAIKHADEADIISDAVLPGTIQVPANGQPIVMLADRQTTGGYARIGTVISSDLPFIVQKRVGQELYFKAISIDESQKIYKNLDSFLKIISATNRG